MTTRLDIDELERLGKAATDAPWNMDRYFRGNLDEYVVREILPYPLHKRDCDFLVAARNHWQAMIDEIRRLRELEAAFSRFNEEQAQKHGGEE